mgnify:CR=1 FL=1
MPGADSHLAAFLPGGQVAVDADNAVLILDRNLKTVRGWYGLQGAVQALTLVHKLLPMAQLPSDPFSPLALPLSIGGPLVLGTAVLLLPSRRG